jgi:hypothetical protein
MALGTITNLAADPHSASQALPMTLGDIKLTITTVVGDSSYPTGGTALTPLQLGLTTVITAFCTVTGSASNNTAIGASYNTSTGKLQTWASTGTSPVGLAETANATNLSGLTITVFAFGY